MKEVRKDAWDILHTKIKPINDRQQDDLFIACISYEPRTTGVLQVLDFNYKGDFAFFIVNERSKNIEKNINLVRDLTNNRFFNEIFIKNFSIDNPIGIIIKIDEMIKEKFSSKEKIDITLDITTFPRIELLPLLYYIRHHPKVDILRILYISPLKYGKWLARGHRYSSIPSFFEGPNFFKKKTALIILTGFESERAISLIDDVEPTKLILAMAYPGAFKEFDRISQSVISHIKILRDIEKDVLEISASDPYECKDTLRKIIDQNSSYDFFIAPMGTKLEVLGTYLAYEENANFRIIYPRALAYNIDDYSRGCRDIYEIILRRFETR
jgi:hypothetical protein